MEQNAARSRRKGGDQKPGGYRMLVSFLLALIVVLLVLNIMMVIRIVGLAAEGKRIGEEGVTLSEPA